MKRYIALAFGAAALAVAAEPHTCSADVRLLAEELRAVRLRLHLLELDYAEKLIEATQQELDRLRAQRDKADRQEKALYDEIAALARTAPQSDSERIALEEIQAARTGQTGNALTRVQDGKHAIALRESQLNQQLQRERRRWEQARAAAALQQTKEKTR